MRDRKSRGIFSFFLLFIFLVARRRADLFGILFLSCFWVGCCWFTLVREGELDGGISISHLIIFIFIFFGF